MIIRKTCILTILIFFSASAFSQVDSTFKDSLNEITIYEYDTVYLQPDTIRLTDTIIDILKTTTIKKKKSKFPHFSFPNFRAAHFSLIPEFIGMRLSAYYSSKQSDSIKSEAPINGTLAIQFNYSYEDYLFSVGIGYSPYREKCEYSSSYFSTDSVTLGSVDSVEVTRGYIYNFNSNYLNVNVLFGRKWELNRKWFLAINLGCSADFLLGYQQGNTDISVSSLRKYDISIICSPQIIYKFGRKAEFYLSPFYQRSLLHDEKYPKTSFQKAGIGAGFNIYF